MRLSMRLAAVGVVIAIISGPVHADLIAYWNFNGLSIDPASPPGSNGVPTTIGADLGSGTLDLTGWLGNVDDFSGSILNAQGGDPAGASLSLVGTSGNGSYIELQFSMAGKVDLVPSFATRGTSTGYDLGQWSYSTDGNLWTDFGVNTATRNTNFGLTSPGTLTALDNAPTAFLRYTLDGATSAGGNNRIDNLLLESSAVPPPPPPITDPARRPEPGDIVFGLNTSTSTTLELVSGPATQGAQLRRALNPWDGSDFIQSVAFDNYDGQLHNVRGNLLGVDFGSDPAGTTPGIGGEIFSFGTNGTVPLGFQSIGNTRPSPDNVGHDGSLTISRLASISVSPSNDKIAVNGYDAGTVIVYDYTPGDTLGGGATLANGRQTTPGSVVTVERTQGTAWIDNNTVVTLNTTGDLYEVDATTMLSTNVGFLDLQNIGSDYTALAYNPDVSPYLYALYSGFGSLATPSAQTRLYILDPTNNYAQITDSNGIDLSGNTDSGREMALDAEGRLFIAGRGSTLVFLEDVVTSPGTIADNSAILWYASPTGSSFNGMDIGFGDPSDPGVTPGDHNEDGVVDARDYVVWRKSPSTYGGAQGYTDWVTNFGDGGGGGGAAATGNAAVPEPASLCLLAIGLAVLSAGRRRA